MKKNQSQTSNLVAQSTASASRLKQQRDSSDPRSEGGRRDNNGRGALGSSVAAQSIKSLQVSKYPESSKGGGMDGDKELMTLQEKKKKMQ